MASALVQLMFQERRRLLFVSVLAFLAGVLFYARLADQLGAPLIAIITGLLYAGVIAPVTLIVCAIAPGFRFMIESIAVSRLLLALLCFMVPDLGTVIIQNPLITALLVVSGGGVLSPLLHGRIEKAASRGWRDRYGLRAALARAPVRLDGTARQHRFTGWLEDTAPIRVQA